MKRRAFILSIVLVSIFLTVGILSILGTADSHRTNYRYLLWKHQIGRYDPALALRYFNVDVEFRISLYGRTRAEVQKYFPVLQRVDESDPYLPYCGDAVKHPGFFWIDNTRWGIIFENDRVKMIQLFKG
jgi:hypothetical protein